MSGLKRRVDRFIKRSLVYFSPTELRLIADHYRWYVEDADAKVDQFKEKCDELWRLRETSEEDGRLYLAKLEEVAKTDLNGYYSLMYRIHKFLLDNSQWGYWTSSPVVAELFLGRLKDAKRYLNDKRGRNG